MSKKSEFKNIESFHKDILETFKNPNPNKYQIKALIDMKYENIIDDQLADVLGFYKLDSLDNL